MNLIEQLGGYELTKQVFDSVPKDGNSYTVTRDDTGASFHSGEIFKALLDYRRQHNVFEVEDWVFPVVRIIDEIEGVGRYICAEKGELVVVREVKNKGAYCSHEHRLDNSFYMKFSEFRHATDEEIKAGRRL